MRDLSHDVCSLLEELRTEVVAVNRDREQVRAIVSNTISGGTDGCTL